MKIRHLVLGSILLGAGCAATPRPYVFNARPDRPSDETLKLLAQSLSQRGHRVSDIDRKNLAITTYWEDTGYRWRVTDDGEDETSIFLRFHVQLGNVTAGRQVTVTADVERCVPYRAVVTRSEVVSTCLKMDGILPTHQKVLDELGTTLSAAVSAEHSPPGRT